MPRVSLTPLATYGFTTELTVRTTDLNYGGHLGNDRLLALLHEARVAFLASRNWTEMDCGGLALSMNEAAMHFKREAFAGDVLSVGVGVAEVGGAGFRLSYLATRKSDGDVIALAETGMVGFNYTAGKVTPLPADVRRQLEAL